jgi:hypothetical protein
MVGRVAAIRAGRIVVEFPDGGRRICARGPGCNVPIVAGDHVMLNDKTHHIVFASEGAIAEQPAQPRPPISGGRERLIAAGLIRPPPKPGDPTPQDWVPSPTLTLRGDQ